MKDIIQETKICTLLVLRILRTDCFKVHVRLIPQSCFTYSENQKIVFVSVPVKK